MRAGRVRIRASRCSTSPRSRPSTAGTRSKAARGIYFAGAYWGYGFHEDGVQSALEVVRRDPRRSMTRSGRGLNGTAADQPRDDPAVALYEGRCDTDGSSRA